MPEGMDPADAYILSDMVPTGFHAVELAGVEFGDTVLVIGIGPVGLMSVAGAALHGASRIIAVGTRPVCVEAAKGYGATDFISYKDGPIWEQVMELTGGKDIRGGLMPGGRLRMEKLSSLVTSGRLDLHPEVTHLYYGWDHLEEALFTMRDKPADLIKPVVVID